MDYTSFLRHYYASLIDKLNKYSSYTGETTILNYYIPVAKENLFSNKKANFDGIPDMLLNINSPYQDFENYLEYYGKVMPDLSLLFCDKSVLREIYNTIVASSENAESCVDTYIDICISVLKEKGVVE